MPDLRPLKIGSVTIGGPMGSATGLAIGSIFYDKHSVVKDPFSGDFNETRAGELIDQVNKLGKRYGVQMAFDIIAASPDAM
jgi:tetrahydromethanopterin S-methyltransferase subunit H